MKTKKTISFVLIFTLLLSVGFLVVSKNKSEQNINWSEIKVSFIQTSSPIFDLNDKAQYVGFSDYVFVGTVENVTYGGKYSGNKYYPSGSVFSDDTSTPYTEYEVSVSQNIKGQLKTDSTVLVKKHAGINTKTNILSILPGDVMPVEGEEYIFLTRATESGDLVILDPHGNIPLNDSGNNVFLNENVTVSVNYTDVTTTAANITNETISTTVAIQNSTTETTALSNSTEKEDIIDSYIAAYVQQIDPTNRIETYISIYDIAA